MDTTNIKFYHRENSFYFLRTTGQFPLYQVLGIIPETTQNIKFINNKDSISKREPIDLFTFTEKCLKKYFSNAVFLN